MIISFYSNYLTHHQIPFCLELCKKQDVEFHFISTCPMEAERAQGGWGLDSVYDFEIRAYESEDSHQKALALAKDSDVMIIGSAPEEYVKYRMKYAKQKLTFRYSERIYKGGRWRVLSPRGALLRVKTYFRYLTKPLYMLCASAYTAGDLAMLGSYIGRCFKWGYFPETKKYENISELINNKSKNSILWVARLIDWKHPETPVRVASRLKQEGYEFKMNLVGNGPLFDSINDMIQAEKLEDCVTLLGTMKPDEVRKEMEKHQVFMFTSDQHEGWGAVLNEAMNSACAVVANDRIGSVPFLLQDGQNGFVYKNGNEDELYAKVKSLIDNPEKARFMGKEAYTTITEEWSAPIAAKRLYTLCQNLLSGKKIYEKSGPCSKADIF